MTGRQRAHVGGGVGTEPVRPQKPSTTSLSSALPTTPFPACPRPSRILHAGFGVPCIWLAIQNTPCRSLRVAASVRGCLNISCTERRSPIPDRGANELCCPWLSADAHLDTTSQGEPDLGFVAVVPPGLLFCSPLRLNGVSLTRACCFGACLQQKEEFQRPQGIAGFLCRSKKRDGCAYKQDLIEGIAGEVAQGTLLFAQIAHTSSGRRYRRIWRSVFQQPLSSSIIINHAGPADPIAASSALLLVLISFRFVSSCGLPGPGALFLIPPPCLKLRPPVRAAACRVCAAAHSQV